MEPEFLPLASNETFQFACHPRVPCFNACCRNLNQFLTPYDILCLKHHLGLQSDVFLNRFTIETPGPRTGLPIVSLKADPLQGWACPFVTDKGCGVYPARPASCRIYPLARAVSRCRNTGRTTEHFALIKEAHCLGFEQSQTQRVDQWLIDQDLAPYNDMNDRLLAIIALKNKFKPGPLDTQTRKLFRLMLYDLDSFRSRLKEIDLPQKMQTDPDLNAAMKNDDPALLALALRWAGQIIASGDDCKLTQCMGPSRNSGGATQEIGSK
jgi:Fe-S-cluster containining protein